MEKSPFEPRNASSTSSVSPDSAEQAQQALQDGGQHPTPRRIPVRRAGSSSLLSRLLAPTYEVEESEALETPVPVNAIAADRYHPVARTGENFNHSPQGTQETQTNYTDDKDTGKEHTRPLETMAQTMRPLHASSQSLGQRPTSATTNFNFHDMNINHVNSVLMDHRDFLKSSRLRGTSLERTPKEKMVQSLPKGAVSNNSGDTGFAHPPGPIDMDSGNISDRPPTEGYRAEYRSWRDGLFGLGMGKAWSIGDESLNQESDGQVEKSITEALAGAEHNSRSRKSSHSVRLFKEGLPEDKSKKREGREGHRHKERTPALKSPSLEGFFESSKTHPEGALSSGAQSCALPSAEGARDNYPESSTIETTRVAANNAQKHGLTLEKLSRSSTGRRSDPTLKDGQSRPERPNILPAQLLHDLRKRHNLTPAGAKGSSFSKSIPLTNSERQTRDGLDITVDPTDFEDPLHREQSMTESLQSDEESGEEKISSALFVPHQSSRESRESLDQTSPRRESFASTLSELRESSSERSEPEQWLVKHEVGPREEEKKISGHALSAKPSPEIVGPRSRTASGYFSQASTTENWVHGTVSEAGYSTKADESGLSQNEDLEITPTDKRAKKYMSKNHERLKDTQQTTKAPLEAIELIPYKHQVGGHTTMWRFSKRAVCKQLNNRENEFYETIEHFHPALLKFMPRYIGVLNVTFEKQLKRKPTIKGDGEIPAEGNAPNDYGLAEVDAAKATAESQAETASMLGTKEQGSGRPRVVSQSLSSQVPTPTVTFADNRHIIPKSFLQRPLLDAESRYKSLSDTNIPDSTSRKLKGQITPTAKNGDRSSLSDPHAVSWGATTVNRKLRYEVFGEAFLQRPIQIQPHKKPGHHHRSLPHRTSNPTLRSTTSESNLGKIREQDAQNTTRPETSDGSSLRMQAIKTSAESQNIAFRSPTKDSSRLAVPATENQLKGDGSEIDFQDQAGTSAPEADMLVETPKARRKRRFSSGGLRRKPEQVADGRGNLKYYAEADDAGYAGDGEDEVFAMDPDVPPAGKVVAEIPVVDQSISEPVVLHEGTQPPSPKSGPVLVSEKLPAATDTPEPPVLPLLNRPVNPKEAQTQRDSRVEYFLLLEDLTAGMKRPCIMDLKMGTRQYGVEADPKKQASQRRKCAETTSRELGVRVCGLQVWDVASQSYIFQDKYFGRDLKAGKEFQDALARFLYDGVDYQSILRHIPTILHKIGQLAVLIRHLNGYRFYASSLLMYYDGDVDDEAGATTDASTVTEKKRGRHIDFKIADFANCVTAENESAMKKPCPPQHPDTPDRGFLRGLRSLKKYFLNIQREVMEKEQLRRDENDEMTPVVSDDSEGDVSY